MSSPTPRSIADAIPSTVSLTLSASERRAVLEIAWLAVASDHRVDEAEVAMLRRIAQKVAGAQGIEQMEAAIDGFVAHGSIDRARADARLRELASALTTADGRALAYRAAHVLARADADASDEEFEFDLQLIDALGLAQSDADAIAQDVESIDRAARDR